MGKRLAHLVAAYLAGVCPAFAEQVIWPRANGNDPAWMELRETHEPGAIAELEFNNTAVHTVHHVGWYTISHEHQGRVVEIQVRFYLNVGPDASERLQIVPPPGYVAIPDNLVIKDGDSGTSYIYPELFT